MRYTAETDEKGKRQTRWVPRPASELKAELKRVYEAQRRHKPSVQLGHRAGKEPYEDSR